MNPTTDSLDSIEDEAARWFWRKDQGVWTDADQAALQAWLDASTSHRISFLRMNAAWKVAARMQALGAGVAPGTVPPVGEWGNDKFPTGQAELESSAAPAVNQPPVRARSFRAGSTVKAAAAMLVMGALAALTYGVFAWRGAGYETAVGGLSVVPLQEGSRITLNTDTRVRVTLTDRERRIVLSRGEAYFEVAKDAARPFVVQVAGRRVVAVGTKFSVWNEADQVRVVVTEGRVKLEQDDAAAPTTLLDAGAVARATAATVQVSEKTTQQAEDILSWRNGYLKFDATPLAAAVAEFNRYNEQQIEIGDATLAQLQVGGNFRPGNTAGFLQFVQTAFPVRVTAENKHIVLLRR